MVKLSNQRLLTIEPVVQNEMVCLMNVSLVPKKTTNVTVENIKEFVTETLYVKNVELK